MSLAGTAHEPAAVPPAVAAAEPLAEPAAEHAPITKPCRACDLRLPRRARFCGACGAPQIEGLERPRYHFPPYTEPPPQPPTAPPPEPPPQPLAPQPLAQEEAPGAAVHQPLFDPATEARVLALRACHELTVNRFERLMLGFRIKPQPQPQPQPNLNPKPARGH